MCGICGWAASDYEKSFDENLLRKMTRTLRHRGPDAEGYFTEPGVALGHRRLSILDIEHGAQPFFSPSNRYVLIYNGEIYNAPELRNHLESKGFPFRTHCDTEVIAVLADATGFDFVNDLEGIFAFGLWDREGKQLLLARDGIGVKPLIYRIENDGIFFASEAKALYAHPELSWSIDPRALHHYLGLNYIPEDYTIYKEARKLLPGQILTWNCGRVKKKIFWSPPSEPLMKTPSKGEIGERVRSLVAQSVKGQLQSDVPLGVFLSSGIDSAVVLMNSSKLADPPPTAFCVGFHEQSFDERPGARETADIAGARLTEFILEPDLHDLIPRMAEHFDEPFADSSAVPVWELCRRSTEHITVALSGEGGDEVFCGYLPYQAHLLAMTMKKFHADILAPPVNALLKIIPASDRKTTHLYKLKRFLPHLKESLAARHFLWKVINDEEKKERLYTGEWKVRMSDIEDTLGIWNRAFGEFHKMQPVTAAALSDMSIYLPADILTKVDISSMAHSLEVRVPLLDRRIVEYVAKLPDKLKISLFQKKKPLQYAFENEKTKKIFHRPKQGFSIPASKWLKKDLKPLFMDAVHSQGFRKLGALKKDEVLKIYSDHENRKEDHSRTLWGLLMLALWTESH